MILVMTTNHPEKLDPALIRDGRIDQRILFDYCDHQQIYKMFQNFYNGTLELNLTDFEKIKLNETKIAPCNIENAMKKYYKDSHKAYDELILLSKNGIKQFAEF
jgi:ATP-dependent 26S proteasome regulatory subunit